MLRNTKGRHSWSRLSSLLQPASAYVNQFAACRARVLLSCSRLFSVAPVPEEELHQDSAEAAAAHKAVHERLVFELFGIREKVREKFSSRPSRKPQDFPPRRIRREDEPALYVTPLRELLKVMQGASKEDEGAMLHRWERQIDSETGTLQKTVERFRMSVDSMHARGDSAELPAARRLMLQWFEPLRDAIHQEMQAVILKDRPMVMSRHKYGPFMLLLTPDQMAVITLHTVIMHTMLGSRTHSNRSRHHAGFNTVTHIASEIGQAVEKQVGLEQVRIRVEQENTKRKLVLSRLEEAVGKPAFTALQKGGLAVEVLRDENLRREFDSGMEKVRAGAASLPDDAREWLKSLEGMTAQGRLDEMRVRYKGVAYRRMQYGRMKLSQAEKMLWDTADWSVDNRLKIGMALLSQLLNSATLMAPNPKWSPDALDDQEPRLIDVPAFTHQIAQVYDRKRREYKKVGQICGHDEVVRRLENVQEVHDLLLPKFMPMLIPPLPWRSSDSGGHLITRTHILRMHGNPAMQTRVLDAAQERLPNGLSQVFDALNTLGEVGWAINRPVLNVVEAAWAAQLRIAGLPIMGTPPALMEKPASKRFRTDGHGGQLQLTMTDRETQTEKYVRKWVNKQITKRIREMHALRCDLNLKLEVAREYRHEPRLYFPHNLDFRGRAYPMHPHLNHMGQDVCRGLLSFADAKPLGPDGLGWLYVMIANSWGKTVDKLDFEGRRQFVQRNLENVLDSAERPLDGTRWWAAAEKPWQFLAACMEVRDALASGNPAAFPSRLPVQMDGSCNGLQHYAALGRDRSGGNAVNLRPAPAPQDVYGEITAAVMASVAEDAEQGVPEAVALQGHINRKLVKQTVMTSVYGVTFIGARQQIQNRLLERGWADDDALYRCSNYAAKLTLKGLEQKFDKAIGIMRWLAKCASVVAKEGNAVAWHTPLGLPVMQPYRERSRHVVQTVLQRVVVRTDNEELPIMRRRQRTAFPPNYVHSLDSTHMMMTALACKQEGIAFAGVHDSFWTHAGDVAVLARQLRRTFLQLHSQPLLEKLLKELRTRYPTLAAKFPELPETGELDLNEILDAEYFFS